MGIARSGLGWLGAKFGAIGLSFLATMYFTRALADPTRVLGLFQVFETVAGFLLIFVNAGIGAATVKRISEERDQEQIAGAAAALSVVTLSVTTVVVLVARSYITAYFGIGAVAVGFMVLLLWAQRIRRLAATVLSGVSRVGRSGFLDFLDILARTIVQIGLVFIGFELFGLLAGAVIGTLAAALVGLWMLPIGVAVPGREHIESVVGYAKFSFFKSAVTKTYQNVDTLVIAAFLNSSAVSVYNVPFRLAIALTVFSGAISTSSMPEISRHATEGNLDRVREILADGIIFSTLLAIPATVGVALLARPIIVTLFTPAFAAGATVAVIAMIIQIPDGMRSVFSSGIDGLDRPDLTLRANVLLIAANGALDLLLVPTVGIEGAAIGSLVGVSLSTAYLGYHLFDQLDIPRRAFPVGPLAAEVAAALIMGGVILLLERALRLPQAAELALLIPAGIVVYGVAVLAISREIRERVVGVLGDVVP